MSTYRLQYLGADLDEFEASCDDIAREVRDGFCRAIMADLVPDFLSAYDFEDLADCKGQIRLIRVTIHDRDLELRAPRDN